MKRFRGGGGGGGVGIFSGGVATTYGRREGRSG